MTAQNSASPSRAIIDDCTRAVFTPFALRAALQLDLFTHLADGAMPPAELASAIGGDQRRLEMLLYQLAMAGFLKVEDERFRNSEVAAHYLVKGKPAYTGNIHELWSEQWAGMMQTAASIQEGVPKGEINYAAMNEDELSGFFRGIHGSTLGAGHRLANEIDFSNCHRLIDIGGGSGAVAIALCQANPNLTATILDLPSVTPIAEKLVSEAGLADRIDVATDDILAGPLGGDYDVAIAKGFLQVLSAADARTAVLNTANALTPDAHFHIVGHIADNDRLSPEITVGFNLIFLNMFQDGEAYTEQRYRDWLAEAGYTEITQQPFPAGQSIISARKGRTT